MYDPVTVNNCSPDAHPISWKDVKNLWGDVGQQFDARRNVGCVGAHYCESCSGKQTGSTVGVGETIAIKLLKLSDLDKAFPWHI